MSGAGGLLLAILVNPLVQSSLEGRRPAQERVEAAAAPGRGPLQTLDGMRRRGASWLARDLDNAGGSRGSAGSAGSGERPAESALTTIAISIAALARSSATEHGETIARGRSLLRARQNSDGSFGSRLEDPSVTWRALAAIADSNLPEDASAARLASGHLRRIANRGAAGLPVDPSPRAAGAGQSLRLAMEFLGASTPGGLAGESRAGEGQPAVVAIFALAGGSFDLRAGYRFLQGQLVEPGLELTKALRLPSCGGALGELHLAARVLAHYRSPRLVERSGATHDWPQELAEQLQVLWNEAAGGWSEAAGRPPEAAATAMALLALDALTPWLGALADAPPVEPAGGQLQAELRTDCAGCHERLHPQLVSQWKESRHGHMSVGCHDCHGKNHSQAFRENGRVSPAVCARCHEREAREFSRSRHSAAARTLEASPLFATTPRAARAACLGCHQIGARHLDGTTGNCNHCHLGHVFSAAQAREPEACIVCHTGDDYPQDLAYRLSKHGVLYQKTGDQKTAPTCVTCHQPAGTHDDAFGLTLGGSGSGGILLGEEAPIPMRSIPPEDFAENRAAMVAVCSTCHSSRLAEESLRQADEIKAEGNALLRQAVRTIKDLYQERILTPQGPLDPILGGDQVLSSPASRQGRLLNRFYEMWRFHYAAAWKGAYHNSFSVSNQQSRAGLAHDLALIQAEAEALRQERRRP